MSRNGWVAVNWRSVQRLYGLIGASGKRKLYASRRSSVDWCIAVIIHSITLSALEECRSSMNHTGTNIRAWCVLDRLQ